MSDKRVAVGVVRAGRRGGGEAGEGMHCMDHPYRSNAGGVCAFCLQEKLSKLVSSSNSSPFFPFQPPPCSSSSSSSSPTSFNSDAGNGSGGLGFALASDHSRTSANGGGPRTMFPFLADTHSKKKNSGGGGFRNGGRQVMAAVATTTSVSAANDNGGVLRRTKSVATRTTGGLAQGGGGGNIGVADSPRKKSFWSFMYISSTSSTSTSSSSVGNNNSSSSNIMRRRSTSSSSGGGIRNIAKQQQQQQTCTPYNLVDKQAAMARQGENGEKEAESPSGSQASSSIGTKVARSRSVGCGSRSFSGDFLDRISTGFGDCALRRVESHREAKPKSKIVLRLDHDNGDGRQQQPRIKEQVKCGGLFRGLGMMSSAYWLSSAAAVDDDFDSSSRTSATTPAASASIAVRGRSSPHGRTTSWGWALASPVRAFRPYFSSKSLYAFNNTASAAPVTNARDKLVNSKASRLDGNATFLAVEI
ncbi:hypothetical protein MUK42_02397 [Musa troglodytarum]|uniref:Uncharacterized protein n=1 Tax=Musa troglodytarum TaxID=320322 RepID=A0A9E7EJ14_9LILI|nr:hypothetical protein MUK42_02397 [Musa troglodytarum]